MHKFLIALAFLLGTIVCVPSHAGNSDGIIAIVNNDVVTQYELEDRIALIMARANIQRSPENAQRVAGRALNALIDEKLQIQEATRLGLEVSDDEILNGMNQLAEQNKLNLEEFRGMMKKDKIPPASIAHQIKAQISWSKVIAQRIRPRIDVTDADIDARIDRMKESSGKEEYLVAEIFLSPSTQRDDVETRKLARELFEKMKSGQAPFPVLAQQYSESAGASRGGVIGWVREGQLPKTVEIALKNLGPKELSSPVQSEEGYHILFLQDKRLINFDSENVNENVLRVEVLNEIGQAMLERQAKRYLTDLRSTAFIEYRV